MIATATESTYAPVSPAELREIILSSYASFCELMQDDGWFDPVHEELCNTIQAEIEASGNLAALREGDDDLSLREAALAVVMPRGSLKSTIVTKYLPAWLALQDPNLRTLIAGNTAPNANKKLDDIRGLFDTHPIVRELFRPLIPKAGKEGTKWTSTAASLNRTKSFPEQTFESAGSKTKVTGRHYNVIIEDDTVAPEKDDTGVDQSLPSIEDVDRAIGWHKLAYPLLVPKGVRIRVVVSTRWCDYDLIAYIREKEPRYKVIDIPAERDGKSVFSMFYSKDRLNEIRESLGSYMYSCLYLNTPIPAGDRLFRQDWFQLCTKGQVPDSARIYVSLDPAISQKNDACETSIVAVAHEANHWFVLEVRHKKYTPIEQIAVALDLCQSYGERCAGLIVETVAYQKALVYFLHDEMRRREVYFPIIEHRTRSAKETRIAGLQPLYENRQVYHLKGLDNHLETQLLAYPHGKLVDIVDALSMQLEVYRGVKIPEKPIVKEESNMFMDALEEIRGRGKSDTSGFLIGPAATLSLSDVSFYVGRSR